MEAGASSGQAERCRCAWIVHRDGRVLRVFRDDDELTSELARGKWRIACRTHNVSSLLDPPFAASTAIGWVSASPRASLPSERASRVPTSCWGSWVLLARG